MELYAFAKAKSLHYLCIVSEKNMYSICVAICIIPQQTEIRNG